MRINKNGLGLTLGVGFATLHLLWTIIVALDWGQVLIDWCYAIHFLDVKYIVGDFDFGTAIIGIVGAFVFGYILGYFFAALGEKFGK